MLLLVSALSLCLVADEVCEAQHLAKQIVGSANTSLLAEDFDFDEEDDDEAIIGLFTGTIGRGTVSIHETSGRNTMKSKSPKALQRGQVRRHSPRNGLPCSHNYTLCQIRKVAWICSMPLFLSETIIFITGNAAWKHPGRVPFCKLKAIIYECNHCTYCDSDFDCWHRRLFDGLPHDEHAS